MPLDTSKINFQNFKRFSNYKISGDKNFFELINPFISFEFLLSMNLCVFRRKNWNRNLGVINKKIYKIKEFIPILIIQLHMLKFGQRHLEIKNLIFK